MESFSTLVIDYMQSVPVSIQMLILALFSFTEGLPVIGSILPGGTIALFAGSLSAANIVSPLVAFLVVGLSSFLGDILGFFLGKRFRDWSFIKRIVEHEKHQKSWDLFDRHIAIISIFGKLIPVVRSTPSIFAGARGIRTRKYILYSLLGSMLWGGVGIYAGNFFTRYFGQRATLFILGIVVISIVAAITYQFISKIGRSSQKKRNL